MLVARYMRLLIMGLLQWPPHTAEVAQGEGGGGLWLEGGG
jgi:hypothetical protein